MNIKELIQQLLDIEVTTDNLNLLMEEPESYISNPEDTAKLQDLILLLKLSREVKEV